MPELAWIAIGLALGIAGAFLFFRRQPKPDDSPQIGEQLHQFHSLMNDQMDRLRTQLDHRLSENVRAMSESNHSVRAVSATLGKLEATTRSLHETGLEISTFQKMLTSPKIRGNFGEVLLNNLLGEVLPADRFELQYVYRNREIADAIIRLQDKYIVAVDAKFPLANYQQYQEAENEDQARSLRKAFMRDVKKHISDISRKYISADEKTLDYAFMYVPVEGIYYETMVRDTDGESLWDYCLKHHVIPVSPNSLLAYLQTVLVGLRGMRIEQQAKEILEHLGQLRTDFNKFAEDFTTVGTHLANAKNRYDDSARRLDKFTNRLEQIDHTKHAASLPAEVTEE